MTWIAKSGWGLAAAAALFAMNACDGAEPPADDDGSLGGSGGTATDGGPGGSTSGGSDGSGGAPTSGPPALLSDTGLYEADMTTLAPGVRAFTPRFPLYSDDAEKKRWLWLPEGEVIDTSDPDYWIFPAGTKLWKEFTSDGVRVETRLMEKRPDGTWWRVAYHWRDDQQEADVVPDGVQNASGTDHDVPSTADCVGCHGSVRGTVLGFSAIQLADSGGEIELEDLTTELSDPVTVPAVPGSQLDVDALGYLHANCGTCHNPTGSLTRVDMDLRLRVGAMGTVEQTPAWLTAVEQEISVDDGSEVPGATLRIDAGFPSTSAVYLRMHSRGEVYSMPSRGTEFIDEDGSQLIYDWIESLDD